LFLCSSNFLSFSKKEPLIRKRIHFKLNPLIKERRNMKELHIFYDKNCKAKVPPVKEALEGVFGVDTTEENLLNLAEGAYDTNRMQYDASNIRSEEETG
jgi:aldehyde:ferredoxin oxidoreductase